MGISFEIIAAMALVKSSLNSIRCDSDRAGFSECVESAKKLFNGAIFAKLDESKLKISGVKISGALS